MNCSNKEQSIISAEATATATNVTTVSFIQEEYEEEMKKKEFMISRANDLATLNVYDDGGPFGCVITTSNYEVIAEAKNCVFRWKDPTAHAEVVAIRTACQKLGSHNLTGCYLFSSCEPCPMCLSAIYWAGIKNVFYCNTRHDAKNAGFDDSFIYDELAKRDIDKTVSLVRIRASNEKDSFSSWRDFVDKKRY